MASDPDSETAQMVLTMQGEREPWVLDIPAHKLAWTIAWLDFRVLESAKSGRYYKLVHN